ncbi:hypothetical protein ACFLZ1_02430 [Patescibacteria group bacterium]
MYRKIVRAMNVKDEVKLVILALLSATLLGGIILIERSLKLKVPEIFIEVPYIPANIIVNTNNEFGPMPDIWRALAQGGEEPGVNMIAPTVDLVKRINPSYIRIDHIFDDAYYSVVKGRNGDGSLNLDFSKLDATVDDILKTGAKPFFSLTYMPSTIASSLIDVPGNWVDWQNLVLGTINHYSSRIDNVYYEVWNEPSLPSFGGWRMYGGKDYRQLYYYAIKGADQANPTYNFKIGGPAIPEMDSSWIELLFDYCLENNLRLDFISWHRYSLDPARFVEDVYEVNVLLDDPKYDRFLEVEKIITEYGPNSYKDSIYSTQTAVANLVAVTRRLLDKVNLLFTFEIKDGPEQGDSGWGLISHESMGLKPKPRYYIYDWLTQMQGQRVEVLGEGTRITGFAVKKDRTVSVVLTNYDSSSPLNESFQLTFAQLSGGKYRLSIQELFNQATEEELDISDASIVINLNLPVSSVVKLDLTKISNLENEETLGFGTLFFNDDFDNF